MMSALDPSSTSSEISSLCRLPMQSVMVGVKWVITPLPSSLPRMEWMLRVCVKGSFLIRRCFWSDEIMGAY